MKLEKITKIKKLLQNIEFFLFAGLIFFVIGIGVVNKITSNRFYFFGNRFDVVLTDSMSSKNENHLDFLEGYDNQIQKFDFVVSEKITKKTKIDIHDIVLFNNPPIGTDMHRVIDIERYGDEVKICNLVKTEFENIETFRFRSAGSYISIDKITFKSFQLVSYSKEPLKDTYYYFYVNGKIVDANYSSSKINSYYKNVVTYS